MNLSVQSTHQKALQINLDSSQYGAFAEIGAGQEVARWFFRVGGASGTVAKTMSAYDMTVSDAIYGKCERYVSRQRLQTMLDHEYALILERLQAKRGHNTKFFVFANTVATRSYTRRDDAHGWMGIRFQAQPNAAPSDIIIHVRLLDKENVQEQESLGCVGVNLIHSAMYAHADPSAVIGSLLDNLTADHVEVDLIKFSGAAFTQVDNRLMALQLVERGLSKAAMFRADGEVVQPAELLYKKNILVERGSFRPVTRITMDMLECAAAQFAQEPEVQDQEVVVLTEMTLHNLIEGDKIDHKDFLDRVDILGALGKTVLISDYGEYHRLATYLFLYTKKMIGIALGVPSLTQLFEEKYYKDLEGGILESFGRLFKNDLKLYVYPIRDPNTGALITADSLRVAPRLRHLYAHLLENRCIVSLHNISERGLPIFSRDVLARIRDNDPTWEEIVPDKVARMIKERKLFNYQGG